MRHLLQFVLAWLIACAVSPVFAQASPQFTGNRELLLAGDFAALERLYPDPAKPAPGARLFGEEMPSVDYFLSMRVGADPATWPQFDKATRVWLERFPDSVPAAIARAHVLSTRSQQLDQAGDWAGVETALGEQERLLMAVKPKATKEVMWHLLHISFARQQGWPPARIRSAIEAGLDVDPISMNLYYSGGLALSPDWRGSAEPLEWLARQGAVRTAPQGAATYAFVRTLTAEFIEVAQSRPFEAGLMDWKLLNEGLTEMHRRAPVDYTLNEHAALACRAGDKGVTAVLLGRIGTKSNADVWKLWGGVSHYDDCKAWAEAGSVKS